VAGDGLAKVFNAMIFRTQLDFSMFPGMKDFGNAYSYACRKGNRIRFHSSSNHIQHAEADSRNEASVLRRY
jgi:hypothetical protein